MKLYLVYIFLFLSLSLSLLSQQEDFAINDDDSLVEKKPYVDIANLQKLVVYPKRAKQKGIEGKVLAKVLVDKEGNILKKIIDYSDHKLFEESALKAIDKYGKLEPAMQGGKPVACWLTIPIRYELRGKSTVDETIEYFFKFMLSLYFKRNLVG